MEALDYDPETGVFTWRIRAAQRIQVGDIAGSLSDGYWRIRLDRHPYGAHQLAWFWVTGTWPTHQVDHIDGDPLNNRFANLRDEPQSTNMQNIVSPNKNGTSGFRGVTRVGSRWKARPTVGGRQKHLGFFDTPEAAYAAYLAVKAEHHGAETFQARLTREVTS